MRKCKLCTNDQYMSQIIDDKYGYTNTRYNYCFQCQPTLDEEPVNDMALYSPIPHGLATYWSKMRRNGEPLGEI